MPKSNARLLSVLAALVALALAIFLVVWLTWPPDSPAFSAEEARALVHAKNVGLGQLENQRVPEGLAAFEQIAAKLPADPLGPRNVAVARVLALGDEDALAEEPAIAAAREALAKMAALEGQSKEYHWLALRVELAAKDFAAAQTHVAALIEADAKDPSPWYARFRMARVAGDEALEAGAGDALDKAFQLAPANAWLLVEWLRATAMKINDALDALPEAPAERTAAEQRLKEQLAQVPGQLQAARATAQAFAHEILVHTRVDVLLTLDEAAEAIRGGDWLTASTGMFRLANVLAPHAVTDQIAVRRHPLENVLDRFQPEFYTTHQVAEGDQPPVIEVSFAADAAWLPPTEALELLGEIRDVALADFDLDGRLDLFVSAADKLVVFSRKAADQPWQEIASAPSGGATALVVQDLDSDFDETLAASQGPAGAEDAKAPPPRSDCPTADVDVALFGPMGVMLVENRFDRESKLRTLVPVAAAKLPDESLDVLALTCADLDADGDLDLVLATKSGLRLWGNLSEWSFADLSERAVLPAGLTDGSQLLAFDWDRDVDVDVLVAAPSGGGWLENLRHGQFRWRPFADPFPGLHAAQALEVVDAGGNATWDIVAAGQRGMTLAKTTGIGGALRGEAAAEIGTFAADTLLTWDYDNDGVEDLLALGADEVRRFRGLAAGKFEDAGSLVADVAAAKASIGDLDGDGDQDVALVTQSKLTLVENRGGNQNHWLDVALQAQQIKGQQLSPSGRVSPYGLGTLLELKAGERYQARVVRSQATHFGLGQASEADVVRVGWLNGVPQNIIQPAADLFVCEQQVLMGSCPYLYAWNGERFEFVTDLLWNAPIGLQLAEGQLAPWRDWEYIKIPGEQLRPRDGQYVLQVTAELWEADYFDQVKLIAVDHPADVEVYSNEKVGPPEIAQYRIHTASQPRTPKSAVNHAGRDLLPDIARADGVYAQTYERKFRQGVVEDHYLELDLGDVGDAERVTLFFTGWMYPAATSTNVALSQGGSVPLARPPSLEVPDGNGGWRESMAFMGFPGGKTKTIAVELPNMASGVREQPDGAAGARDSTHREADASRSPRRVRIRTSMEIYWDQIFFTVDEPAVEVRTTELALVAADLHWRGFSRVVRDEGNGPERFLYDDVAQIAKWPPMLGCFTRYGDVRELAADRDDRLVVMGAGDQMTLRFAALPDPPPGWKRDYLLYSVGWDKDANLQTVLGQSAEPLPFQAMTAYPWPPGEKTPDSPQYGEYLQTYQTRTQSPGYERAVLRYVPGTRLPMAD